MSHKTLISGTVYEISGGKALVNGTAYSIKSGKTLVDGTAYEVGFGAMAVLTIIGDGNGYATVTIGETYYKNLSYGTIATIEVPVGTVITCSANCDSDYYEYSQITLNGTVLVQNDHADISYDYTVVGNATFNMWASWDKRDNPYGNIDITEE